MANHMVKVSKSGQMEENMMENGRWENPQAQEGKYTLTENRRWGTGIKENLQKDVSLQQINLLLETPDGFSDNTYINQPNEDNGKNEVDQVDEPKVNLAHQNNTQI